MNADLRDGTFLLEIILRSFVKEDTLLELNLVAVKKLFRRISPLFPEDLVLNRRVSDFSLNVRLLLGRWLLQLRLIF